MSKLTHRARDLRQTPTWAERTPWRIFRDRRLLGYKFRRQRPFGPYVLDFYCVSARLDIELDGDPHGTPERQTADRRRDQYLSGLGIGVLRFSNMELLENRDGVLIAILRALDDSAEPSP